MIKQKEENKKFNYINKILIRNKKKKIFRALKNLSFFQPSKDYDKKLQNIKQNDLQKLNDDHNNQKQQLLLLINQISFYFILLTKVALESGKSIELYLASTSFL